MAKMTNSTMIASRALSGKDNIGTDIVIEFRLLAPRPAEFGWVCSYEIMALSKVVRRDIFGTDSLHALMLALEAGQAEVLLLEKRDNLLLDWQGSKFKVSRKLQKMLN